MEEQQGFCVLGKEVPELREESCLEEIVLVRGLKKSIEVDVDSDLAVQVGQFGGLAHEGLALREASGCVGVGIILNDSYLRAKERRPGPVLGKGRCWGCGRT